MMLLEYLKELALFKISFSIIGWKSLYFVAVVNSDLQEPLLMVVFGPGLF